MGDAFDTALFKQSFQRVFSKDGKDEFKAAYGASIEVKTSKELKVSGCIGNCTSLEKKGANISETVNIFLPSMSCKLFTVLLKYTSFEFFVFFIGNWNWKYNGLES